jgi:acyl carrier protein
MASAAALVALGTAILSGRPRVTIADVHWPAWVDQFPPDSPARAWFSEYVPQDSHDSDRIVARSLTAHTSPTQTVRAATEEIAGIRTATKSERAPRMEAFVRASARKVLGLSSEYPVPGETPLQQLGLDSLMALELRNLLSQALGRPLRATLLFDYNTVRALAQYLLGLAVEQEDGVGKDAGKLREGAAKDLDLSSLSDSEAEELLLAELDRGQRS